MRVSVDTVLAHAGPEDLPPPFTWLRLLTEWAFQPLLAAVVALVGLGYLWGVVVLRRRGDSWPVGRTISFVGLGLGSLVVATQSAIGAYDTVLVSVHMVQHMILTMISPVFLALGAPVTLALRTFRPRPRRRLLSVLHSRVAKVLSFPVVAGAIFVANPWVLYFTPLYEASLRNPLLHDLQHAHFLLVGCLFFWPLLGTDPVPGRVDYPIRLIVVFATLPFHAFLGLTIMGQRPLLAQDWYAELDRGWPPSATVDQEWAGGILWSSGDLVGLLFFFVLFAQWLRSSRREAEREDRRLDRLEAEARRASGSVTSVRAAEPAVAPERLAGEVPIGSIETVPAPILPPTNERAADDDHPARDGAQSARLQR